MLWGMRQRGGLRSPCASAGVGVVEPEDESLFESGRSKRER
jgi:hypothetical protein